MAQILVPGTTQCVISGVYGTQPWACVWHWKFDNSTANWSQTEVNTLATLIKQSWQVYAAPLCATTVHLTNVQVTDIGSTTPVVGIDSTIVPGTGSSAQIENSSTCTLISLKIPVRYKGGHPRTYLPWGTLGVQASEFQWTSAYVSSATTAMINIINNVRTNLPARSGNQVSMVVPRYTYQVVNDPVHFKYVRQRTGLKSVDVVFTVLCNPTYGSQRRRLKA